MVLNTKDVKITLDEAKSSTNFNYNIMPSVAFLPSFMFNDTASNLTIQRSFCNLLEQQL